MTHVGVLISSEHARKRQIDRSDHNIQLSVYCIVLCGGGALALFVGRDAWYDADLCMIRNLAR